MAEKDCVWERFVKLALLATLFDFAEKWFRK